MRLNASLEVMYFFNYLSAQAKLEMNCFTLTIVLGNFLHKNAII